MERISVYFKDIKLGELSIVDDNYVYVCIPENIEKATQNGFLKTLFGCDKNFISKDLPLSLKNFVVNNDNIKFWSETDITKDDSDFDRLYKIAKLNNLSKDDFYISLD